MIRRAFGVPRAQRRPSFRLKAFTPPSSNASPSVAASRPRGGPSSKAPSGIGAATGPGLSIEGSARPRAGFDDTRTSPRVDEVRRRPFRDRSRVCSGARSERRCVSSGLLPRCVLARARETAVRRPERRPDSVAGWTGTRGLAGSAGSASSGSGGADATGGVVEGAGAGSGGTSRPSSAGGSTAPGLEAGRKSNGST
jgi:hypothetical protein